MTDTPDELTLAEQVWADAEADPAFRASLDEGLADAAAGRTRPWCEIREDLDIP